MGFRVFNGHQRREPQIRVSIALNYLGLGGLHGAACVHGADSNEGSCLRNCLWLPSMTMGDGDGGGNSSSQPWWRCSARKSGCGQKWRQWPDASACCRDLDPLDARCRQHHLIAPLPTLLQPVVDLRAGEGGSSERPDCAVLDTRRSPGQRPLGYWLLCFDGNDNFLRWRGNPVRY